MEGTFHSYSQVSISSLRVFLPVVSSGDQVGAKCTRIALHFDVGFDLPVSVKLELEFDLGAFIPPIL